MACLYVNPKGVSWHKHSYSAGGDWDQSAQKYYLRRIQGWRPKDDRASFKFGRALEESIEFFHDNNGEGAVEDFIQRWLVHKDDKEMKYTKTEKDWDNLNRCGQEMLRLYKIRQPELPIPLGAGSVFQREYSKEVFPNDLEYSGIDDAGKLDIVAYVDPNHPMLPKVDWKSEYGVVRPLIVDIKTSCLDFPETPGIAAYDLQLRRYSWQSGIRDVSLLWFKKCSHNLSKGSSITLLKDVRGFKAGEEAVVAKPENDNGALWIVKNDNFIEMMDEAQGRKQDGNLDTTKAAKERKADWLLKFSVHILVEDVTRQRLQFNAGFVTKESADDAGAIAARQIVQIVNAWKTKSYPQTMGIRFPNDNRNDPYFRAFVLNDLQFREQNFTKSKEETFDDMFEVEEESNE